MHLLHFLHDCRKEKLNLGRTRPQRKAPDTAITKTKADKMKDF